MEAHFGAEFQGFVPEKFGLQGKNAVEQFTLLTNSYIYKRMDFYLEIRRNHKALFLNYPFWQKYDFKNSVLKEKILQAVRDAWLKSSPKIPLPMPVHQEITDIEPKTPDSWVDPDHEDAEPTQQPTPRSLADTLHKDTAPRKHTDLHSLVVHDHEDAAPLERPAPRSLVDPVHEDATLIAQTDSHSVLDPNDEGSTLIEQIDSHFEQGLELGLRGKYYEAKDERQYEGPQASRCSY
jgi:hypothetical protein